MQLMKSLLVAGLMSVSAMAWAGPVNINTADAKTLETLDGIGPAKAQAIVDYRKQNGLFRSVEDLGKVDGIGDKTLENLRGQVSVGGGAEPKPVAKPAAKSK